MAQAALIAQGASSILGGMSGMSAARSERDQANRNAFIGETRALQTGASVAESLNSELATLRTTMAQNGQGGGAAFFQELRKVRGREGRIAVQNERQNAADYRTQGRNAMAKGRAALISGIAGAGPSMFELYERQ